MFTKELFGFLIKVITSWQIIVVTVCLIIYLSLVSYVASEYHPGSSGFSSNSRKSRPKKEKSAAADLPQSSDDDLGI
jgi:hypothetical protein